VEASSPSQHLGNIVKDVTSFLAEFNREVMKRNLKLNTRAHDDLKKIWLNKFYVEITPKYWGALPGLGFSFQAFGKTYTPKTFAADAFLTPTPGMHSEIRTIALYDHPKVLSLDPYRMDARKTVDGLYPNVEKKDMKSIETIMRQQILADNAPTIIVTNLGKGYEDIQLEEHMVTLVGVYTDANGDILKWKYKNSWGKDWAKNGYGEISAEDLRRAFTETSFIEYVKN
jgi:hypothetical protein